MYNDKRLEKRKAPWGAIASLSYFVSVWCAVPLMMMIIIVSDDDDDDDDDG